MSRTKVSTLVAVFALTAALPGTLYAGGEPTAPPANAAGSEGGDDAGQIAFNTHCRTCHSVKPEDNRLGPTLHGIHGAKAGQVKGFGNYSGQLNEQITWDDATLDKFLANPASIAANTTMKPFGGIADAGQRKLIIDYLKAQK
ncbi:c-type cytochrome [Hyphomicrobium sp.]|uniref:c-type cytochrome n=1 Tax=Hyphomicrobium sp. TaxID=82 RepID=UPI003F6F3BA0